MSLRRPVALVLRLLDLGGAPLDRRRTATALEVSAASSLESHLRPLATVSCRIDDLVLEHLLG